MQTSLGWRIENAVSSLFSSREHSAHQELESVLVKFLVPTEGVFD